MWNNQTFKVSSGSFLCNWRTTYFRLSGYRESFYSCMVSYVQFNDHLGRPQGISIMKNLVSMGRQKWQEDPQMDQLRHPCNNHPLPKRKNWQWPKQGQITITEKENGQIQSDTVQWTCSSTNSNRSYLHYITTGNILHNFHIHNFFNQHLIIFHKFTVQWTCSSTSSTDNIYIVYHNGNVHIIGVSLLCINLGCQKMFNSSVSRDRHMKYCGVKKTL